MFIYIWERKFHSRSLFFPLAEEKFSPMLILIPNCYKNRTFLSYLRLQFFLCSHFPRAAWHSSAAVPTRGKSSTTQAGMNCSGQKWWLSCLSPFPFPYYICNLAALLPREETSTTVWQEISEDWSQRERGLACAWGRRSFQRTWGSKDMGAWSSDWRL